MRKAMIIAAAIAFLTGISAAGETTTGGNVPKVLLLGSLSKVYEPVRFDHAEHISMAGGCEECHHQHRSMQVQTCSECHRIDPSFFKKNVNAGTLKPCGECHAVTNRPGDRGRLELKAAYHQACFKCHKEEVAGKPKGCTGMCHVPKGEANREGKK
ncbi:MAG: cytochrome c3 family protein [Candidatus Deferrimicrobiaceae bacterium]